MPVELSGIVVVDKPAGISSAGVVARVKAMFGAKKVGHAGTLDPFATGVLVCCINRATRLSRFLLAGDKTYEAEMVLGVATDTQDATGKVVQQRPLDGIDGQQVHKAAGRFVGPIHQIPPVYSALKHQGTPLYKLARQNVPVEKPARQVRVYQLKIREVNLPAVHFTVACSSGTYIRTLCADMGKVLGCGGHLRALRRTASCGFSLADAVNLEELARSRDQGRLDQHLRPMNAALPFVPAVPADETLARKIQNGAKIAAADFSPQPRVSGQGVFKVVGPDGHLIAVLGESSTGDNYNYYCVF